MIKTIPAQKLKPANAGVKKARLRHFVKTSWCERQGYGAALKNFNRALCGAR